MFYLYTTSISLAEFIFKLSLIFIRKVHIWINNSIEKDYNYTILNCLSFTQSLTQSVMVHHHPFLGHLWYDSFYLKCGLHVLKNFGRISVFFAARLTVYLFVCMTNIRFVCIAVHLYQWSVCPCFASTYPNLSLDPPCWI